MQPTLTHRPMHILFAVVEDLYTFAVSTLLGWRTETDRSAPLALPASRMATLAAVPQEEAVGTPIDPRELPQKHTVVYCAQAQTPLRTTPEEASDTTIAVLAYGDMVMMLEAGEAWSYIAAGEKKGYVPTTALAHKAANVYPDFTIGEENGPRADNTMRLRSVIRDEFSASLSQLCLQAHEYVYYKLVRRGVAVNWPDVRPRTPGSWARILGMLEEVSLESTPHVGSVMEYVHTDTSAHLAYVEQVFGDSSIRLSEANWPDRGIYNERVLTKDEWQSLSPTFITFR